jgi:two-component system, NarL family, nitrate/nitrite response regulator NarL
MGERINEPAAPTQARARVLIVEDHALLAQSVVFALRAEGFDVELAERLDGDGILATAERLHPDVVLLDLDIGGALGTSLGIIDPLKATGARVVMVTGVTDPARLAECVEAGAIGLISKADPFDQLIEAVKDAVELGMLLSPAQRDELLRELRRQRTADRERLQKFEQLTKREAEVLGALMDGLSADQIAAQWFVSLATVRSQIRSLLLKLGVNSQLSAVALARQARWELVSDG